jgi:tetratricopeptide (TPR) repeat protein
VAEFPNDQDLGRQPLCFVLMPFGAKPGADGGSIDFDAVYRELIAPAVEAAGLEPLRADQELIGGVIHKPMYERLVLADYAIADLTTANANVFYELGVRHAVRPYSTVLISAETSRVPFDLAPDRVLPYSLEGGRPAAAEEGAKALTAALEAARRSDVDSPIFQLLQGYPDIDRLKTDTFRDEAAYSNRAKKRLAKAREEGADAVRAVRESLGKPADVEAGVLVDLLLSFRATEAWREMIDLVEAMPEPLRRTVLVREQLGFALNRDGRSREAEKELKAVLEDNGPSSETYGLLGRVYKDRWEAARERSRNEADGQLDLAIDAYRRGFEADWRDAYPGVNAVTLMEIRDPGGAEQRELVPVVAYANRRRIERGQADYWDHATALELAVIGRERETAERALAAALACVRERWEPKSTLRNLAMIRDARAEQGERIEWAEAIEADLRRAAGS